MVIGGQWAVTMTLVSEIWYARKGAGPLESFRRPFLSVLSMPHDCLLGPVTDWMEAASHVERSARPSCGPLAYVSLKESSLWIVDASRGGGQSASYRELFSPALLNHTVLGTLVVFIGSFGAWSLNP